MTVIVDGTNGLTFPDVSVQATSATNATNISSGTLPFARLPAGSVLQVQSTTLTTTFTGSTAGAYTDITGMSVSITPKSATSNIYIIFSIYCSGILTTNGVVGQLLRGSTPIAVGTSVGSRTAGTFALSAPDSNYPVPASNFFLDSPATTSATTYKLQYYIGAGTIYVNRGQNDTNSAGYPRLASTMTAMEIAA